jgi:hypothetical protein
MYRPSPIRYARACSISDQFFVRGSLLTNKLMSQGFQLSRLQAAFRKFYRYNDLFGHTTFLWATCCLICSTPIVKPFLTHWSWLRFVPFIESGNGVHGGCDRSTGNAYSSMAPDPTSDIFRDPCTPILWFVFPIGLMRLITGRYFCHFILQKSDGVLRRFLNDLTCIFVIISPLDLAIWTILNSLYPRMICTKFHWNWPAGSGEILLTQSEDAVYREVLLRWSLDSM